MPDGRRPRRSRLWRLSRGTVILLVVLALLLIAARAALPHVVKWYVNKKLAEVPEYRAVIGDVDIHLWRGAYSIQDIDVVKTSGEVPVPFFSSPRVDLSVEWHQLWNGALVGEIEIDRPKLNLVVGPTEAQSQTEVDSRWQDKVKQLFPLRINRLELRDGEVHYRDFHSTPKVDVPLEDLNVVVTNLTNSEKVSKTLAAKMKVDGRPLGDAKLGVDGSFDPYEEKPTFDVDAKLERVDLRRLNDFLKAYGNFDVEKGRLSVYSEMAASKGRFTGYVKPLIEDLDVLDWNEETDNLWQRIWEGMVGATSTIFRNQPRDRFGTRVEFSGSFDDPQYSLWRIVIEAVRNAFVKVLPANLEGSVGLGDAKQAENEAEQEEKAEKRHQPGVLGDELE